MKCNDCKEYGCPNRNVIDTRECFYTYDLPKKSDFDWQSFRAEAAKDILCSVLQTDGVGDIGSKYVQNCVMASLLFADELIKQLKEKEEK